MAIKTIIKWDRELSAQELATVTAEINRCKDEELLVGFVESQGQIERHWVSPQAAQDWIDFLNSLETKPYHAEIVVEELL